MGFGVNEIKSNFTFGGARPTMFDALVINKVDFSGDNKFRFTCKAASLPESQVTPIDMFYKGRVIGLAGDRPAFPEWTVTVYNDEDFLVRNAFERWLSAINEHEGNIHSRGVSSSPESYKSDALVNQYSKSNENVPIKTVRFVGLWPTRLGEIILDWENANQVETFEVAFKFDYWTSIGTTDGF